MMTPESETATAILDAAECLLRTGGYDALDQDETGRLAGVDPAHVTALYSDRADLAIAVLRRYSEGLLDGLGSPDDRSVPAGDRMRWLVRTLRRTLGDDGRMCPCATLAGEAASLPAPLVAEVRRSLDRMTGWIAQVIAAGTTSGPGPETRARAIRILATLQGAMIVARVHRDPSLFDQIASGVVREALRVPPRSIGNADAERPWPARPQYEERSQSW